MVIHDASYISPVFLFPVSFLFLFFFSPLGHPLLDTTGPLGIYYISVVFIRERKTCLLCSTGLEAASHKGRSQDKVVCWGAAYREPTRATCLHERAGHPHNVYTREREPRAYRPPCCLSLLKYA